MDQHIGFESTSSNGPTEPVRHGSGRTATRARAENQLRDIAYVLHLTRRVREEILAERGANMNEVCLA
jgi:hypothetical protein